MFLKKNVYISEYMSCIRICMYVCMFLIIREYTHIQVMEMCILTYCMYVQYVYIYIYIYIQAYIYKCDISIDLIIRHTSISYVLYLYTHIYTWLCNIVYIQMHITAPVCHIPTTNQLSLTVDFWSHSGWAPRTWISSYQSQSADFKKDLPKPPVFKNHRDCSPCLH